MEFILSINCLRECSGERLRTTDEPSAHLLLEDPTGPVPGSVTINLLPN